jgi:hypothetical protein
MAGARRHAAMPPVGRRVGVLNVEPVGANARKR